MTVQFSRKVLTAFSASPLVTRSGSSAGWFGPATIRVRNESASGSSTSMTPNCSRASA